MATSLTISSSSYAGALALPYIQAAILSGDTLAKGYVAIKENVKYKAVIKKLSSSGLVVAATCDFTTAGSVTLAETVLTTTDLNTNVELCKKQFVQDWEAYQLEAMEMILHKISRISNGDPNYADSWRDIAGYATLVADRLEFE